jgi:hypothetical protein
MHNPGRPYVGGARPVTSRLRSHLGIRVGTAAMMSTGVQPANVGGPGKIVNRTTPPEVVTVWCCHESRKRFTPPLWSPEFGCYMEPTNTRGGGRRRSHGGVYGACAASRRLHDRIGRLGVVGVARCHVQRVGHRPRRPRRSAGLASSGPPGHRLDVRGRLIWAPRLRSPFDLVVGPAASDPRPPVRLGRGLLTAAEQGECGGVGVPGFEAVAASPAGRLVVPEGSTHARSLPGVSRLSGRQWSFPLSSSAYVAGLRRTGPVWHCCSR